MNYIREAENYLKYYRHLKQSVESTQREIDRLTYKDNPRAIKAAQMDETGIRAMMGKDDAWNDIYKILLLTECKNDTEKAMQNIDDVLDMISSVKGCGHYGKLLKLWYVDKKEKEEIEEELYISHTQLYVHRRNALETFSVALFGLNALKAV